MDRQGNDLGQADFNALPPNQRKILEDMGFEFKTGRNRYLLTGDDVKDGRIIASPKFKEEEGFGDIINPTLTIGGIDNIEKTERIVFLTGLYYLMKDQYNNNLDGAAVAGAAAGGN